MVDWNEVEAKWREVFSSEKCPPVIGLAPLAETEVEEIARSVAEAVPASGGLQMRFASVLRLMELYPATMAVWLARKAGDAYRDGNFWEHFTSETRFEVPPLERGSFANALNGTCKRVMANFTPPPHGGHFLYVEACLFHAGLPLCHCGNFSEAVRWVERHAGLPSLDEPDAGASLRDEVLCFPLLGNVPILRKALVGPAGALICEVALRVVFGEQDYGAINPRLGGALERAFANVRPDQLRRSARPPFLRLGADLASFEIVGPRQPSGVIMGSGIVWRINDEPHRVSLTEEFVFPVQQGAESVKAELRGLTEGRSMKREFALNLALTEIPFVVFDSQSRKERTPDRGETVTMRPGDYLIVHTSDSELDGGERLAQWPDRSNTTSALALRPGNDARLVGEKQIVFKAAKTPYLDLTGKSLRTNDLERIHFGWSTLPDVWIPSELESETWTLHVTCGLDEFSWILQPGDGVEAGMRRFRAATSDEFLRAFQPGLLLLQFVVSRASRRPEIESTQWYWNGLVNWREGDSFELSALPQNLSREHSAGFNFDRTTIRHRSDGVREHVLSFFIPEREGLELRSFRWTRAGVFLESFERRAGAAIQADPYPIPYTFGASVDSARYLRIWLVPADDAELVVNGKTFEQISRLAARSFVDVSLATHSTHHTHGRIVLHRHGIEQPLAFFTRPLVPRFIDLQSDAEHLMLLCKFDEALNWVRVRVRDLITSDVCQCEGMLFDTSGHATFACNELPVINCANVAPDSLEPAGNSFRLSLTIPRNGWPVGIWMIEMDVRRDEIGGWQLLQDAQAGCLCIVHAVPPEAPPLDFRRAALWWAFGQMWHSAHISREFPPADGNAEALCALLNEITVLLARGYNDFAWSRLRILEMLSSRLGREAARLLGINNEQTAPQLFECAAQETNPKRSLLITIPELLAIDAKHYRGLPPTNALFESMRWCGELAQHGRVICAFRELIEEFIWSARQPGLMRVLQNFKTFSTAIQSRPDEDSGCDLKRFDFAIYWTGIIGKITDADSEHAGSLDLLPEETLGREHVLCALAKWWCRRERGEGGAGLTEAHQIFVNAPAFRQWLASQIGGQIGASLLEPWLQVDLAQDALTGDACRFMSIFALACRATSSRMLSFQDVLDWLYGHHTAGAVGKAFTTLVALGPELFGYHLMLWELIVRTAPHD
jgi:hypothetical protein